ncbi:MAG: hypothetical protein IPN24_18035 [Betaproteobacteria bacterium]|nr:hypothetical protein [Betaproteobacteria bacterium]
MSAKIGRGQHVLVAEALQLLVDNLLARKVDQLPGDRQRGGDVAPLQGRRRDVTAAITTSAPSLRASSIGRLVAMPPSTSSRPSTSTGAMAPGPTCWLASPGRHCRAQHDRLAGLDHVGRHRQNRIGGLRKSVTPKARVASTRKNDSDRDPRNDALRQRQTTVLDTEPGREQRLVTFDLR